MYMYNLNVVFISNRVREASMSGLQDITSLTVKNCPELLQPTVYVVFSMSL